MHLQPSPLSARADMFAHTRARVCMLMAGMLAIACVVHAMLTMSNANLNVACAALLVVASWAWRWLPVWRHTKLCVLS